MILNRMIIFLHCFIHFLRQQHVRLAAEYRHIAHRDKRSALPIGQIAALKPYLFGTERGQQTLCADGMIGIHAQHSGICTRNGTIGQRFAVQKFLHVFRDKLVCDVGGYDEYGTSAERVSKTMSRIYDPDALDGCFA